MERLTIEYDGNYVPKALCSVDRYGQADDCDICHEYCMEREDKHSDAPCTNCAIQKCFNQLAKYEKTKLTPEQIIEIDKAYSELAKELAELKKRLPPCKVGDTVYWVNNHYRTYGDYKIDEEKVERLIFDGEDWIVNMGNPKEGIFGKTVFLTKEEAETKLKEMEGE